MHSPNEDYAYVPSEHPPLPPHDTSNGTGEPHAACDVYGQNSTKAQEDRKEYQDRQQRQQAEVEARQFAQPTGPVYYHQAPSQPQTGDTVAAIAEGEVVFARPVDMALPPVPNGLVVTPDEDTFQVLSYSVINIVCVVVNVIIFGSCALSLMSEANVFAIIVGAIAVVMAGVMLYMTRDVRLVFDKVHRQLRVEERRLIAHCCAPKPIISAPFSELHGAGFDGIIGAPGELYIDVHATRLSIAPRLYNTEAQMFNEVFPWRLYVAQCRGLTVEEMDIAMTLMELARIRINSSQRG
jgi:hypothetical protein